MPRLYCLWESEVAGCSLYFWLFFPKCFKGEFLLGVVKAERWGVSLNTF